MVSIGITTLFDVFVCVFIIAHEPTVSLTRFFDPVFFMLRLCYLNTLGL